jgi:hypothetical protein
VRFPLCPPMKVYTTYYSHQSVLTGKNYSEGWFIWLSPDGAKGRFQDQMVCHVINDIYNTNGETHGYLWRMLPNNLINGWMNTGCWYKTQEEAMTKAMAFIDEELKYLEKKTAL